MSDNFSCCTFKNIYLTEFTILFFKLALLVIMSMMSIYIAHQNIQINRFGGNGHTFLRRKQQGEPPRKKYPPSKQEIIPLVIHPTTTTLFLYENYPKLRPLSG